MPLELVLEKAAANWRQHKRATTLVATGQALDGASLPTSGAPGESLQLGKALCDYHHLLMSDQSRQVCLPTTN